MPVTENTSGIHLWLVLWKAARAVEARADASIRAIGLCRSDFGVLEALLHKGPLPVNTIGRKVLLTSGSMTAAVDRLERRGLVRRRPDAADRRARRVHLTAAGRKLITRAFQEHERALEETAATLAPKERAALVRLLKKLGFAAAQENDERIAS
ncbi:MAG: MarR family transcriptional regulator [Deltaproteobacteria bacterium]|nr:MarR family transcriptional regulator [Deltaproteobacteria bacterium]